MDTRTRILQATADLLATSATGDVSTRAVCAAAGVRAPSLYRLFGDKRGLLTAVVDAGFEQYLDSKRALPDTDDPVTDLYRGWTAHLAFALAEPNFYRLMHAPAPAIRPAAAVEAHELLVAVLRRCAVAGRLRVGPRIAARMIMSANVGVALSMIHRPDLYPDADFGDQVRDGVFGAILADPPTGAPGSLAEAAITFDARLARTPPDRLTPVERDLLHEWLARITDRNPTNPRTDKDTS